jgi:ureidoglycolate dehydrogenase (NAD+)
MVDAGRLRSWVERLLRKIGFDDPDAEIGAKVLVRADLRGHRTHGVRFLPIYLPLMRGGGIRPTARPRVVRETASTAVLDGDGGLGQIVAYRAAELGIRKALESSGAVTVLVRNSNHFGAADYYPLMCAETGLIGLVMTNTPPVMSAPGSRRAVIGNAPVAYGIPGPEGRHLVLDIALSATAGVRVATARQRGEAIPEGWLIDADGRPTTDPGQLAHGGSLVPAAGHKGWGLALLVETLAGVLSGAGVLTGVSDWPSLPTVPSRTGHAMIVIDPGAFMDRAEFDARVAEMVETIHAAPTTEETAQVRLPGERALEHETSALAEGLELDAATWHALCGMAAELNLVAELSEART